MRRRLFRDFRFAQIPKHRSCLLTALSILLVGPCLAGQVTKTLADGVTLTQIIQPDGPDAMVVNVLKLDTKNPNVKLEAALAGDTVLADDPTGGRETVSKLVARKGALAGVNADFFPYSGDPLGLAIVNGDLVSEPYAGRSVVGISRGGWVLFDKLTFSGRLTAANGACFKISGINRARGPNELICYSPSFGCPTPNKNDCVDVLLSTAPASLPPNAPVTGVVQQVTCGPGSTVPAGGLILSANGLAAKFLSDNLRMGDKVTLRFDLISEMGKNWTPVVQAVGGGPWLVKGGQIALDGDLQKFSGSLINDRHPRTAVGMTAKKELLLVTVDGRQWISRGMTLDELARLMQSLGAVTAINLDGGGSTAMSVRGMLVNSPSEGAERLVANALIVRELQPASGSPDIRFSVSQLSAQAGVAQRLTLLDATTGRALDQSTLSRVVWGARGCRGFANQWGLFVPLRPGNGYVVATLGDKRAEIPVTVTIGPPTSLTAVLKPDPSGDPNRGLVEAKLTDGAGNAISGQVVSITVIGGISDFTEVVTDNKGIAVFTVTWDAACDPATCSVAVSSGKVTPVTVTYPQVKAPSLE
ncbi:MAG: phosphodiester glycosidase family protein [Armatimonadota bacterium]|nr:phosphodiester glycosidase family protein [Armatimonadota bacterium]